MNYSESSSPAGYNIDTGFSYGYENSSNIPGLTAESDGEYEDFFNKAQFITGVFCYPIACLFGLTGNTISIIVLSHKKMISSTTIYLIALAISDSIKLINDSFYFLTILLLKIQPGDGMKLYAYLYPYAHYFFNMSTCTTAWITISVAAERYILVCHATKAKTLCSIGRAKSICAFVFITMSLLTVPFSLRYQTVVREETNNTMPIKIEVTRLWKNRLFVDIFTRIASLLRSIIPLIILCILNFCILRSLSKSQSSRHRINSRHKITSMLLAVVFVFMVCVTPDAVISCVGMGYADASPLFRGIREITDFLLLLNSATNFILYCIFNKLFRKNFEALFFSKCTNNAFNNEFSVANRASHCLSPKSDKFTINQHKGCPSNMNINNTEV